MDSIFTKPFQNFREVASDSVAGGVMASFLLNKDEVTSEHILRCDISQVFTSAPTGIDTDRVGEFLDNVKLHVSGAQGGDIINLKGVSLRLLNRLYERQPAVTYTLGTPTTVSFSVELHYENDSARRDLVTALNGLAATQVKLDVTPTTDTSKILTGGAGAGTVTCAMRVFSVGYDADELVETLDRAGVGELEAAVSSARREVKQFSPSIAAAGSVQVELDVGNTTRAIMIEAETAAGVLSDSVVSDISLVIGGKQRVVSNWTTLRDLTTTKRGVDVTGVVAALIDDDEYAFLDLSEVKQARLVITTSAAAGFRVTQDMTK